MASYAERMKNVPDEKLRSNYRLNLGFAIGFAVLLAMLAFASQFTVLPGLLGVVIIGGNGYAASKAKQELERRANRPR